MPLPQALARFNRVVTNRITGPVAGYLPGFGVLIHEGRSSGKEYRTPLNVFRREDGFEIALTYGPDRDWLKNVRAAGGAKLKRLGKIYAVTDPRVVMDPPDTAVPRPVRSFLHLLKVHEYLLVDEIRSS